MDSARQLTLVEESTRENILKAKSMAKANISLLMEICTRENGKMESKMELEKRLIFTDTRCMATLKMVI